MKIKSIFDDILKNKSKWLQARKGSEFEDRFETKCKSSGFTRYLKEDFKNDYPEEFKIIKILIHDDFNDIPVENILKNNLEMTNMFISQPFGSQNYPDFLIFTERYIIPIEIKYSSEISSSPMWNGNIPKSSGLYLFGNNKKQEVTFFKGIDVLPNNERENLIQFWEDTKIEYARYKHETQIKIKKDKVKVEYGFDVYIRKTFQQNKQINSKAITNFFTNKNKEKLEESLLLYLDNIDEK